MTTFVALYRGQIITEARLVAVSADPSFVAEVSSRILQVQSDESPDPVIARVDHGKARSAETDQAGSNRG